jgi:hypothetical protein
MIKILKKNLFYKLFMSENFETLFYLRQCKKSDQMFQSEFKNDPTVLKKIKSEQITATKFFIYFI